MTINISDYSNEPLPGCIPELIHADNYLAVRDHLVSTLSKTTANGEAVKLYDIISDVSISELIDAREYVLNELQFEIRRTQSGLDELAFQENEKKLMQDWAESLSERFDTDTVLDLINKVNEQRKSREEKYQ